MEKPSVPEKRLIDVKPEYASKPSGLITACMASAVELEKTKALLSALESQILGQTVRLETAKASIETLTELNETRKAESEAMRTAIAAKNETIAAKNTVITAQDELVDELKRKKTSTWRRIGDVLMGAAATVLLR